MRENIHQRKQGCQPHFMIFTADAALEFGERPGIWGFTPTGSGRSAPVLFHYRPSHGYLDSQELVALSVLAGAGLEKSAEAGDLRRIRRCQHCFVKGWGINLGHGCVVLLKGKHFFRLIAYLRSAKQEPA